MQKIRQLSGAEAAAMGVRGITSSGNSDAPAVEISYQFITQSYFDSTLLEKAILPQAPNEQIVSSTKQQTGQAGYALGLHPSSQTPIAVQFKSGQQQGSSAVFRLKPGEVIRPFGEPGGQPGRFSGFEWGLPFGWLGGGSVSLILFRTADAKVDWLDRSEIVFHRTRMAIIAPAAVPASTALRFNWPTRFPWPKALQGANSMTQKGAPALAVTPTRTVMSLRGDLAAAATMRMYFIGSDEFAEASDGTIGLVDALGYDVTWGTWASVASANYATQNQFQFMGPEVFRIGANQGSVILVDKGATLAGKFVDVVRYGVL